MNNKRAKKIRKAARNLTAGQPNVDYYRHPEQTNDMRRAFSVRLTKACTRGLYQRMKAIFKMGPDAAPTRE